jgi:hypothetical protein
MERTRLRKPSRSQYKGTRPVDPALLAPAAKSTPPEREHPIPKHAQTREVPWYRVIVEVALHDRLEPSAGLAHGIAPLKSVSTRRLSLDRQQRSPPDTKIIRLTLLWRRNSVA